MALSTRRHAHVTGHLGVSKYVQVRVSHIGLLASPDDLKELAITEGDLGSGYLYKVPRNYLLYQSPSLWKFLGHHRES